MRRPCSGDVVSHVQLVSAPVTAGPWAHVDPPGDIPGWIGCDGFAGALAYLSRDATSGEEGREGVDGRQEVNLFVRAVALPDREASPFAVVVDLPLNAAARSALRAGTGVDVASLTTSRGGVQPLPGRVGSEEEQEDVQSRSPLSSAAALPFHDWSTGSAGQVLAVIHVDLGGLYDRISAGSSLGSVMLVTLATIGVLFLIIEGAALAAGLSLARSITGSVHELFEGTERVQKGDFTHRIAGAAPDQLGQLARSFNSMTASIQELLVQEAEKKRLEEELRIAHEIQMSLLPQGPIQMPGLSVSAICVPAREVGGDYYDFLPIDDHRIGVLIADVSGKGTSAALYMAELKGLMLSLSRIYTSPRELLVAANRIIRDHLDPRSFITIAYAVIDWESQTMTYARAGHTPLIHLPANEGGSARLLQPEGLVLGLAADYGALFDHLLQEEQIPLEKGDLYVFFTDGISEAMNASDDWFGEPRLRRVVEIYAHLPPDQLREHVLREIAAFVGDAPQHDDMTMIILRVDGLEPARRKAPIEAAEVA
jgi:serine phosphatase RsbU (regulator of sigma subunit)